MCGTVYDESEACRYCGSGGCQVSDLFLDTRSLPKRHGLGIAKTIAGEIVVSEGFVQVFQTNKLIGGEFRAIKQRKNPSLAVARWYQLILGEALISVVAPTRAGIKPLDDDSVRLPNQTKILEQLNIKASWCDKEGQYRCPLGHTIGLNLLSELWVKAADFHDCDIAFTKERVGVRRGLLRPEPLLVISPRFRELLVRRGLKGMAFEVVHLVPP